MLYSQARPTQLAKFAEATGIPVCETQGGKSSLPDDHPLNMAAVGVTGTSAANRLAEEADVVLAVGTRLQDFTTGSWALFKNGAKTVIGLNVQPFDAGKHRALTAGRRRARGLEGAGEGARRLEGAGRLDRAMPRRARPSGRRRPPRSRPRPMPRCPRTRR